MLSEGVTQPSSTGRRERLGNRNHAALIALTAVIVVLGGVGLAGIGLMGHVRDAAPVQWTYPAIAGHGGITPLPGAAVQPGRTKVYRAIFAVSSDIRDPSRPNPALESVARAVNVFASAGVPLSHLHFIAVIYGGATPAVLDDAHYRAKFDAANPNIDLIRKLKQAGVKVEVCGQSLAGNHFRHAWVNKDVTISLSALSDLVIYGNQGYSVIKH